LRQLLSEFEDFLFDFAILVSCPASLRSIPEPIVFSKMRSYFFDFRRPATNPIAAAQVDLAVLPISLKQPLSIATPLLPHPVGYWVLHSVEVFQPQTNALNLTNQGVANFEVAGFWFVEVPAGDRKSVNVVSLCPALAFFPINSAL
jgi:hypothetical protein